MTERLPLRPSTCRDSAKTAAVAAVAGLAIVSAVATGGCGLLDPPPPSVPTAATQRGVWVWSNLPAVDKDASKKLWNQVLAYDFNTLYFQSQTLVYDDPPALRAVVVDAAKRGVAVELLIGRHAWARPAEHAACLAVVNELIAFVVANGSPRPSALHVNVEAHALPEWTAARDAIANAVLDLIAKVASAAGAAGLQVAYDLPAWYDGVLVTRAGKTRPLSEWIADAVDRVVIMDYRDTTAAQLALIQSELAYARQIGRPVVIATETDCAVDAHLTYCEEGGAALRRGLADLAEALAADRAFAGVAVHHWQAIDRLGP